MNKRHDTLSATPRSEEQVELLINSKPGISVHVEDRAVALGGIVEYLNAHARAKGAEVQMKNPRSDFRRRYGTGAGQVLQGMKESTATLHGTFNEAVKTLASTEQMTAATKDGEPLYDEDDIENVRMATQIEVNRTLGRMNGEKRQAVLGRLYNPNSIPEQRHK